MSATPCRTRGHPRGCPRGSMCENHHTDGVGGATRTRRPVPTAPGRPRRLTRSGRGAGAGGGAGGCPSRWTEWCRGHGNRGTTTAGSPHPCGAERMPGNGVLEDDAHRGDAREQRPPAPHRASRRTGSTTAYHSARSAPAEPAGRRAAPSGAALPRHPCHSLRPGRSRSSPPERERRDPSQVGRPTVGSGCGEATFVPKDPSFDTGFAARTIVQFRERIRTHIFSVTNSRIVTASSPPVSRLTSRTRTRPDR